MSLCRRSPLLFSTIVAFALLTATVGPWTAVAFAEDSGGGGDGGGKDGGGNNGGGGGQDGGAASHGSSDAWDVSGPVDARLAVSRGWALPLGVVLASLATAVPGKVLAIDLQRSSTAGWFYKFLVLTGDQGYREVIVDALSNAILKIRQR